MSGGLSTSLYDDDHFYSDPVQLLCCSYSRENGTNRNVWLLECERSAALRIETAVSLLAVALAALAVGQLTGAPIQ